MAIIRFRHYIRFFNYRHDVGCIIQKRDICLTGSCFMNLPDTDRYLLAAAGMEPGEVGYMIQGQKVISSQNKEIPVWIVFHFFACMLQRSDGPGQSRLVAENKINIIVEILISILDNLLFKVMDDQDHLFYPCLYQRFKDIPENRFFIKLKQRLGCVVCMRQQP